MIVLYGLVILATVALNAFDYVLTVRFIKKLGLGAEANPLARMMFEKYGPEGVAIFKSFTTGFYALVMAIAGVQFFGPLLFGAAIVVLSIYIAVVTTSRTMLKILE